MGNFVGTLLERVSSVGHLILASHHSICVPILKGAVEQNEAGLRDYHHYKPHPLQYFM